MITDSFFSGPVPPWTAAPDYNGANWSESFATLHIGASIATHNEIYQAVANSNLQIRFNMAVAATGTAASIATFRVNATTGARLELRYLGSPANVQLVSYANWAAAAAAIATLVGWSPPDLGYHTYEITLLGQYVTLIVAGTTLINHVFTGNSGGGVGFDAWGGARTIQAYTATAITGANPNPGDITAAYTGKFGGWTAGQKIGCALKYVHLATGLAAPEVSTYCIST